jgi:hypothetical protein
LSFINHSLQFTELDVIDRLRLADPLLGFLIVSTLVMLPALMNLWWSSKSDENDRQDIPQGFEPAPSCAVGKILFLYVVGFPVLTACPVTTASEKNNWFPILICPI